jgi:hypothetical protein
MQPGKALRIMHMRNARHGSAATDVFPADSTHDACRSMRTVRRFPALLLLLLLAACNGDGLAPSELVGDWVQRTETEAVAAWSRHELRLEIRGDGSYTWGNTTHADWGRPGDKLLGYSREHGRYSVEGDSLVLQPQRSETWDYLTGGPTEQDLRDRPAARFHARVTTGRLVLNYISYPLDAPEETTLVLRRD